MRHSRENNSIILPFDNHYQYQSLLERFKTIQIETISNEISQTLDITCMDCINNDRITFVGAHLIKYGFEHEKSQSGGI